MPTNQASSSSPFSVSQVGETLSITAEYPFLNDIRSDDESILVEDMGSSTPPYINLSIVIDADASVQTVLEFDSATEEGTHTLKVVDGVRGIVFVNASGELKSIPLPTTSAVLVTDGSGACQWMAAPEGDAVLGFKEGAWHWFEMATCEEACGEES